MKKLISLTIAMVTILAMLMMTACGGSDAPESDLAYVQDKGTLVVGITDFAPMDYKDDNGEWIGFDADLARAYAESIGVEVEFIEINWDSKEMELEDKNIDCVWNGMTLTDGVKEAMETSKPYCNNSQVVVVKADKAADIASPEDCKGLQFAVEAGSAGEDMAIENGFDYIGVETQADAVMEVSAGTAEACVIDALMANAMVGEGTSYPELASTIGLNDELYGVGFRKGSDMAASLDEFLSQAYADGLIAKLAETYKTSASIIEL